MHSKYGLLSRQNYLDFFDHRFIFLKCLKYGFNFNNFLEA